MRHVRTDVHSVIESKKNLLTISDKDLCFPNPCKNDAHCETHGLTFVCQCILGYKGKHCEGKK